MSRNSQNLLDTLILHEESEKKCPHDDIFSDSFKFIGNMISFRAPPYQIALLNSHN